MSKLQRSTASVAAALLAAILVTPAQAKPVASGHIIPGQGFSVQGVECKLIGVPQARPAAPPFGIGECPGVRPGALVETDKGFCTLNFLFTGSDGHRYMGTAGHCILGDSQFVEDIGEQTWPVGAGPVALDGSGRRIGEFAYAVLFRPKDFALIRLDPGVAADPQMCHFGGPTGVNAQTSGSGLIHHRGNGLVFGEVLPARTSYTISYSNPDTVLAHGAAMMGDSGGGVVSSDGKAVGALVSLGISPGGIIGITRLGPQLARASQVLSTQLTLVTAPLL